MEIRSQQILCVFFFVFSFPVIIHPKKLCPVSSCSSNSFLPVTYPFKLETDTPSKNCHNYINLKCNDLSQRTSINLPDLGDFYVSFIDYYSSSIRLSDPGECLPRRLMTNFQVTPLEAFRYRNYTFYTCPRKTIPTLIFFPIECMSNSTHVTIAADTFRFTTSFMEETYGCETIVSSIQIPVSPTSDNDDLLSDDLQLTWDIPACKECKEFGLEKSGDDSQSHKWPKIFSSPLFIPSVVVLVAFFLLACFLRLIKLTVGRHDATGDTTNMNANTPQSITTTSTTLMIPPTGTHGTPERSSKDDSTSTKTAVVDETPGTSLPNGDISCSICLEEYQGRDKIKYLSKCGHYFHAECVDQWLHKSTTCPVCRTKLSSFSL